MTADIRAERQLVTFLLDFQCNKFGAWCMYTSLNSATYCPIFIEYSPDWKLKEYQYNKGMYIAVGLYSYIEMLVNTDSRSDKIAICNPLP